MTIERAHDQSVPGASGPDEANASATPGQPSLKPGGIGTGVAFDWALAVQIVTDGFFFLSATFVGSSLVGKPLAVRLALALASLVAAALIFAQGEALRRGRRVARIIQMVANALLVVVGLVNLPGLITALTRGHIVGNIGSLVVELVLLVLSPLIVWLLTRKRTRDWFATTTSAEARARHSGRWLFWMALYAIIGGLAVAFANYY